MDWNMKCSGTLNKLFRQHAASIYGFVRPFCMYACQKKIDLICLIDLYPISYFQPCIICMIKFYLSFSGRRPSRKGDLWWKTTFSGRQWILPLTVTAQQSPNQNYYQLSQPEIEFAIVEKYMWHCACTCVQKRQHF